MLRLINLINLWKHKQISYFYPFFKKVNLSIAINFNGKHYIFIILFFVLLRLLLVYSIIYHKLSKTSRHVSCGKTTNWDYLFFFETELTNLFTIIYYLLINRLNTWKLSFNNLSALFNTAMQLNIYSWLVIFVIIISFQSLKTDEWSPSWTVRTPLLSK